MIIVTAADIGAEKHVYYGLVQIWKLKFGHKANFEHMVW